jgi:hypothetical protein
LAFVEMNDVARLAEALAGVRHTAPESLAQWRFHGRLVARQLDAAHLVIRAGFEYRDSIVRQFPGTFSVPTRYVKHMMVVADLVSGDRGAIEDAIEAAWELQRSAGFPVSRGRKPAAQRDTTGVIRRLQEDRWS